MRRDRDQTKVFVYKELQTTQVNVTYMESVRIKKHTLCLTPPFLCAEWVPTMQVILACDWSILIT